MPYVGWVACFIIIWSLRWHDTSSPGGLECGALARPALRRPPLGPPVPPAGLLPSSSFFALVKIQSGLLLSDFTVSVSVSSFCGLELDNWSPAGASLVSGHRTLPNLDYSSSLDCLPSCHATLPRHRHSRDPRALSPVALRRHERKDDRERATVGRLKITHVKSRAMTSNKIEVGVGPDFVIQATNYTTTLPDGAVCIRKVDADADNYVPVSVPTFLRKAAESGGEHTALAVKRDSGNEGEAVWTKWTYRQYLDEVEIVARAFIKLGEIKQGGKLAS